MVTLNGASINYEDTAGTALIVTAAFGNGVIDMMRLLIERGGDVNSRDPLGETAIMKFISTCGNAEQIELLLESKVNLELCDGAGQTALTRAADAGREEVVKLLLNHGAEVEGNLSGPTPLYLTVHNGHAAVVKLLLESGADPKIKTNWQQISSLELARRLGKLDILREV